MPQVRQLPSFFFGRRTLLKENTTGSFTSSLPCSLPITSTSGNNATTRSSNTKRLLFFLSLCFLFLLSFVFRDNPSPSQDPLSFFSEQDFAARYADAPHCTFEQLAAAYPNPNLARNRQRTRQGQCWKLDDEVAQVPTTAILNRNYLQKLGQGKAGSVSRALVQLGNDNKVCYCALKTDLCQESFLWRWSATSLAANSVSCVQDGSFLLKGNSFLMGEYTGMLLQYSHWRRGLPPPPEILPNWAVVKAPKSKHLVWTPSYWGYRARDETIVGILMPLTKFQGLWDMYLSDVPLPDQPPDIAELMLPAARGLQTLHGMGLVHQDMHSANVVVAADTGQSMLADLGLVSKLHDCTLSAEVCDYCTDASIGNRRFPHKAVEGLNARESDAYRFAELIWTYFFRDTDLERRDELLACTEAGQVVRVLEGWLHAAGRKMPEA